MRTVEEIVETSFVGNVSIEEAKGIYPCSFDTLAHRAAELYTKEEIRTIVKVLSIEIKDIHDFRALEQHVRSKAPQCLLNTESDVSYEEFLDKLQQKLLITKSYVNNKEYYSLSLRGVKLLTYLSCLSGGIIYYAHTIRDWKKHRSASFSRYLT